ncbi:MAG: tetratricopeptide repeat protein [Pseudomonadota bacterium]
MAQGSQDPSDGFIREVDEAVRQDRWMQLWKTYGTYAIGAAVAIVVGTAVGVGWRAYQDNQREAEAERFMSAVDLLDEDRPAEAAAAFAALAQDSGSGYGMLARLHASEALGKSGDAEGKLRELDQLAADDAAAPMFRDLAALLAVQQRMDDGSSDRVEQELARLSEASSPWRHSALELTALIQIRAGDIDGARNTLSVLVDDPLTPPGLARRAAELLSSIGAPPDASAAEAEVTPSAGTDQGSDAASEAPTQ